MKQTQKKLPITVLLCSLIGLAGYVGWAYLSPQSIQVGKFSVPRLKGWEEYSFDNPNFQTQLRFTKKHQGTQITLHFIQWHVPTVTGEPSEFLTKMAADQQDTKKRTEGLLQGQIKTTVTRSQSTHFRGWPAHVIEEEGDKLKKKSLAFIVNNEYYDIVLSIQGELSPESLIMANEAWQKLTSAVYSSD